MRPETQELTLENLVNTVNGKTKEQAKTALTEQFDLLFCNLESFNLNAFVDALGLDKDGRVKNSEVDIANLENLQDYFVEDAWNKLQPEVEKIKEQKRLVAERPAEVPIEDSADQEDSFSSVSSNSIQTEEAAKTSIEIMVEAYNAAIVAEGEGAQPLTQAEKETKFIEELKAKLGITDSPAGFDKTAKDGFNAMRRFYKGAEISEEEKANPKVFSDPTFGEKVKACLLMLLKIVTLGLAAIPEATVSTRANKVDAQGFQKMVDDQKAKQPAEEPQI